MAHPQSHAESSVKRFGGVPEDYIAIHSWFDESKAHYSKWSHRALRHHTFGIFECEKVFGVAITNSDGKKIPVRVIGEQHVREDCDNRIPSVQDWLEPLKMAPWMGMKVSTSPEKRPLGENVKLYELDVRCADAEPTKDEIIHALQLEVSRLMEE
jgi:hypothetical protein